MHLAQALAGTLLSLSGHVKDHRRSGLTISSLTAYVIWVSKYYYLMLNSMLVLIAVNTNLIPWRREKLLKSLKGRRSVRCKVRFLC